MPDSVVVDDVLGQRGTAAPVACRDADYATILRLDQLLAAAHVHDGPVDRMLFLASHQIYELWFALILRHLEDARTAMFDGDAGTAAARLERLPPVMRLLTGQLDLLATLTPESFEAIRASLGSASGFQSVQFRELEFLCGLKDPRYLATRGLGEADRRRLTARLGEPSVADAYDRLRRDATGADAGPVTRVGTALLDFDEAVVGWRARHASLAERLLGDRSGTGGSAGASYLWRATRRRLFAHLWPAGR
jgi:tryptophan 2,3-dioxygenase